MIKMSIQYTGQKRCQLVHEPSQATIVTDAPKDNHGLGQSFSPTDLTTSSLAACMLTVMGIHCEKKGWDFTAASIKAEKHMQSDPRRISEIHIDASMSATLTSEQRAELEHVAHHCPVRLSLNPEIKVLVKFNYI